MINCFKENCKKYQEERKRALEENESVMDAVYDLADTDINCKNCDYNGDCNMTKKPEFNVYDMLVFEDQNGSIYQDCVREIINKEGKYDKIICNDFIIDYDTLDIIKGYIEDGVIYQYDYMDETNIPKYNLKEIWTRTNENIFKKVWKEGEEIQDYICIALRPAINISMARWYLSLVKFLVEQLKEFKTVDVCNVEIFDALKQNNLGNKLDDDVENKIW